MISSPEIGGRFGTPPPHLCTPYVEQLIDDKKLYIPGTIYIDLEAHSQFGSSSNTVYDVICRTRSFSEVSRVWEQRKNTCFLQQNIENGRDASSQK